MVAHKIQFAIGCCNRLAKESSWKLPGRENYQRRITVLFTRTIAGYAKIAHSTYDTLLDLRFHTDGETRAVLHFSPVALVKINTPYRTAGVFATTQDPTVSFGPRLGLNDPQGRYLISGEGGAHGIVTYQAFNHPGLPVFRRRTEPPVSARGRAAP